MAGVLFVNLLNRENEPVSHWKKPHRTDLRLWNWVERQHETYFNTEISSVHIIAEEKVACAGWRSSHLEQLHQVKELPMDVSTYWKRIQDRDKHSDVQYAPCIFLSYITALLNITYPGNLSL